MPSSPEISSFRDNVDLIKFENKTIYLVGTAHISKKSTQLAEDIIREVKPDTVAIELCLPRYQSLQDPERWKKTDIVSVIRAGKAFVLMAQLLLAGFQKKLGGQLDIKPGAEMLRAAQVADELGAKLVFADREIRITLKRTWASLSIRSMFRLLMAMGNGVLGDQKISEEEIEKMKSSDALHELMKDFSDKLPEVRKTLIDERDQYLTSKVQDAPGEVIVAVVGAGHVPGMKQLLGSTIDIGPLEIIPEKSALSRITAWALPAAVLALIVWGFFSSGAGTSFEMINAWFWINGLFAAFGAALALAHPLTILAAFVSAPFTSLNPFIASGWVAGLVEAMLRKPLVSDLENIADDVVTLKGIWSNRVSRILLVVALTNIFGALGAIFGVGWISSMIK
ncbi:MAG: TraB/GumN family protein [Deltaproteobacteria bacterium]|nr:TraB/GumN family protein [Deltaproteobacteria bacterium]